MPETFMKAVMCPYCPEGSEIRSVPMVFMEHRGPYKAWWDESMKVTVTAEQLGSRCVREFWLCKECETMRWFDVLIDKKMGDLPPELREAWRTKLSVLHGGDHPVVGGRS